MEGGDANEPGDAGGSPGKSSLFFLTAYSPWNRFGRALREGIAREEVRVRVRGWGSGQG